MTTFKGISPIKRLLENKTQDVVMILDFEKLSEEDMELLIAYLIKLKTDGLVSVYASSGDRVSFETQLSVQGELQQHTENRQKFRVILTNGTYCYFNLTDIVQIGTKAGKFEDGSIAVIKIKI